MRTALLLASVAFVAATANIFVSVDIDKQVKHNLEVFNCELNAVGLGVVSTAECVGAGALEGVVVKLHSGVPSSGNVNLTTISIGATPCPHALIRHQFLTTSTDNSSSEANVTYDAFTHHLALTHLFLYNENNSIPGAQPSELVAGVPLCFEEVAKAITWDPVNYSNWTYDAPDGTIVEVHNFTKCGNITRDGKELGKICFSSAIGNGSYVYHGVQRFPGQVKIDTVFFPSTVVQTLNTSSGVTGLYFSSADSTNATVNLTANTACQENAAKTVAGFQPNLVISFGNGAAAYLDWNKTVVAQNLNGTMSSANVNVTVWDTATFTAVWDVTGPLSDFASSSTLIVRSALVFSFEQPLGNVQTLHWDPDMGVSTGTSSSNPASPNAGLHAGVSWVLCALVCLLLSLMI